VLVLTEELLLSLALAEVAALASELYAQSSFAVWLTDLMSPMAARQMQRASVPSLRAQVPHSESRLAPPSSALRLARSRGPADTRRTAAWVVRSRCPGCCRSPSGWLSPGREALAGCWRPPCCSYASAKPDAQLNGLIRETKAGGRVVVQHLIT
jgi:hypothetical protein